MISVLHERYLILSQTWDAAIKVKILKTYDVTVNFVDLYKFRPGSQVSQCSRGRWAVGLPIRSSSWTWNEEKIMTREKIQIGKEYLIDLMVRWCLVFWLATDFILNSGREIITPRCSTKPRAWALSWRCRASLGESLLRSTCRACTPSGQRPKAALSRSRPERTLPNHSQTP
jgi:hypothetical protein